MLVSLGSGLSAVKPSTSDSQSDNTQSCVNRGIAFIITLLLPIFLGFLIHENTIYILPHNLWQHDETLIA